MNNNESASEIASESTNQTETSSAAAPNQGAVSPTTSSDKKSSKLKYVVLAGIGIALIAGIGLVLALGGSKAKKAAVTPTATTNAVAKKSVAYIGFSNAADQPFWIGLGAVINKAAQDKGVNLIDLTPSTGDSKLQAKALDDAITAKVDGIIIGAIDPAALQDGLNKAAAAHIPVITVDTAVTNAAVKGFIATDNVSGAQLAGKYIAQQTGGKGTVLVLGGTLNHPNGDARKNGVISEVTKAGMQVIFKQADWDDQKAYSYTQEELSKPGNAITAIFAAWDPGIESAKQVVVSKNLGSKVILVGFDGLHGTLTDIKAGTISADVSQPYEQIGSQAIDLMKQVLDGKAIAPSTLIPGTLVTKANVDQFLSR